MSVTFIIVGAPRTGSTLLVKTLNSLDGVRCHGELLLPTIVRGYEDGFVPQLSSQAERDGRARRLLDIRERDPVGFVHNALNMGDIACGCKILYEEFLQSRWSAVTQSLLASQDIRFVHLVRENSLRRYISMQRLMAGGPIHSGPGGGGDHRIKVQVDIDDFLVTSKALEEQARAVSTLVSQHAVLRVSYESLSSDIPATVTEICRFLNIDIDPAHIVPALHKVGSQDLRLTVSNFQDLIDHEATRDMALSD